MDIQLVPILLVTFNNNNCTLIPVFINNNSSNNPIRTYSENSRDRKKDSFNRQLKSLGFLRYENNLRQESEGVTVHHHQGAHQVSVVEVFQDIHTEEVAVCLIRLKDRPICSANHMLRQ